jgi:hypothetical protein
LVTSETKLVLSMRVEDMGASPRLAELGTGLALAYSGKGWGTGGDALAPPGFALEQTVGGAPGSERLYSGASVP